MYVFIKYFDYVNHNSFISTVYLVKIVNTYSH